MPQLCKWDHCENWWDKDLEKERKGEKKEREERKEGKKGRDRRSKQVNKQENQKGESGQKYFSLLKNIYLFEK